MSMLTKCPEISVVMPVKDGERYLGMAIDSVLAQSFDNFEFIIINDGSSDRTAEIIAAYQDKRIRVISHNTPQGIAASINAGLDQARGKYIARMDADDCCLPKRFELQYQHMERHSHCVALGCSYYLMDENDKLLRKAFVPTSDAELRFMLLYSVPFCHPSLMYRKSVLEKRQLRYCSASGYAEDYEFLVRLSQFGALACTREYLFHYRTHAGGVSKEKRDILVKNFATLAIPHIKSVLSNQCFSEVQLARFVETSASKKPFTSLKEVDDYLHMFSAMVQAYSKTLKSRNAISRVKMNAAEILFKKILIKDSFIKQPSFLLRYILRQESYFMHFIMGAPRLTLRALWY